MALFEIYTKKRGLDGNDEHILIYRDRISYTALIFPPLWFLLNKNFFLVPVYITTLFLFYLISTYLGSTIIIFSIIFIHLFFGFQSNLIREWLLNLRNYKLEMIVTSESQISAYNIYINNKKNEGILSENPSQSKSGTVSGDEEAILSIF
tara:strand:- start:2305 stop:2754 length:450 start_codon:yes stop_codon:yes gene_type:complete